MSYDLYFVRATDAASAEQEYMRVITEDEESADREPAPLDLETEAWKLETARAVVAAIEGLSIWERDFAAYARSAGCSEDEARLRLRHLEINEVPDVDCGLQVMIFDQYAGLHVPYWGDLAKAKKTMGLMMRCAAVLRERGGLWPYDPQLGRVLQTERDWLMAAQSLGTTAAKVQRVLQPERSARKPWWKFW